MYYVTVKCSPKEYSQLSFDDFFSGATKTNRFQEEYKYTFDTRTSTYESIPQRLKNKIPKEYLISCLERFNLRWKELIDIHDKASLYHSFKIPKHSGGLRQIDAPNDELKCALSELKLLFETKFFALYHTCAFAYVKHRNTIAAVQRHQYNNSRWFLKEDCKNFFGNTTLDFTMKQLAMIFPFCEVVKDINGKKQLELALSLCFLNGGLPQGTPISPMLTNLIMIPIDYTIAKYLREEKQHYVYTRYADDMDISSYESFEFKKIEQAIINIFKEFGAPFSLNQEKTHYGSSAGRNWLFGLMLNKDNKITIGHQKKKQFKVMLYSLLTDKSNWQVDDAQAFQGIMAYYESVEKDYVKDIVSTYEKKYGNGKTVKGILKDLINCK